jgi:hypothetical protein
MASRIIPNKIVYSYQWALQHLTCLDWMVKIDNDMFARVMRLEHYTWKITIVIILELLDKLLDVVS